jgi:hypothetical protein
VRVCHQGTARRLEPVQVVASDALRSFVGDRGGVLYVRTRTGRCCSGPLTVLDATTETPDDLVPYRRVEADGLVVLLRSGGRPDPDELVLTLEGRRRRRPCAYWNGCALVG